MNRYAPLANLQEVTEVSLNLNKTSNVAPTRNLKKSCAKSKRKKIVIKGDSHARGIVAEIVSSLRKDFEVTSTVIPGARLDNITNVANGEISSLQKKDAVIVIGGANDINKNETNIGLTHLRKQEKHKYLRCGSPPTTDMI
jgi:hypothetical protein